MDALAPPIATFTDWTGLARGIKARRMALGLSQLIVDELAGLPSGYTAKIEMSATNPTAKNARSIGKESLPLILGALGMELILVPDARRCRASKSVNVSNSLSRDLKKRFGEIGRKGAIRLNAAMTPKQRRASARRAARARWAAERERSWQEGEIRRLVPGAFDERGQMQSAQFRRILAAFERAHPGRRPMEWKRERREKAK